MRRSQNKETIPGVNELNKLFGKINEKYKKWFNSADANGNYSIYGVYKDDIKNIVEKVQDLLVKLATDCFLTTDDVNKTKFKLDVQNSSENKNEIRRIKKYMWSPLIHDGSLVVSNSVSYDASNANHYKFIIVVDVQDSSGERNSNIGDLQNAFIDLQKKVNDVKKIETGNNTFYALDFDGNKRPYMRIDVNEKNDYQELLQEYVKDVFLAKALFKYILVAKAYNDNRKDKTFKKVEYLFKATNIFEKAGMIFSPTLLKLEDLIFDDNKQIVLTGAPGTGKTYSAQEYVMWQALTEYVEEKNIANDSALKNKVNQFVCYWKDDKNVTSDNGGGTDDAREFVDAYKEKRFHMVQFHPSYDYTDFVEGLRPIDDGNGGMKFVKMDGEFKAFCREAAKPENKEKKYYFVIDEINRADLSKVFGELMYCLEEDYRGASHKIKTQYSNLNTYGYPKEEGKIIIEDIYKDGGFYIPENVIIIGTMNDIDRSVDTFDFALRRRFRWIKVGVDKALLNTTFRAMNKNNGDRIEQSKIDEYVANIDSMNKVFGSEDKYKIIFRTPEDYHVGPAYFKGLFKGDSMDSIWQNKVEPLLREYVRGRDVGDFLKDCEGALKGNASSEMLSEDIEVMLRNNKKNNNVSDEIIKRSANIIKELARVINETEDFPKLKGTGRKTTISNKLCSIIDLENIVENSKEQDYYNAFNFKGKFKDELSEEQKGLLHKKIEDCLNDKTSTEAGDSLPEGVSTENTTKDED
ncbi:MAG: AAA family ATPase [Lachnospiraceae bacterium]|nr:AAA family ATPase [Lachnospiraceae bacterium]